jgi:hypothetical protein
VSSVLLWVRLELATGIVLWPGLVVARAVGTRDTAAAFSWSLTLLFGALALTFVVGTGLTLTLLVLLAVGLVARSFRRRRFPKRPPGWIPVALAGTLLGLLLWHVAGEIGGDGLFHLARVRKLDSLGGLSLHRLDEFPDGGLHPGYAFPLWHGFLAIVAKVAGVDPARVVLHEASILAPLAVLAWFEAGWALFRSRSAAWATAAASVALGAMASGHGGSFTSLALPATVSQRLLAPAAIALAIETIRVPARGRIATTAAAGLALVVVHPTYALFVLIPFAGFLAVRLTWVRKDLHSGLATGAALALPAGAFALWLLPILRDTASIEPRAGERARALHQYATQVVVAAPDSFHLAPQVLARSGAVAVAGLVLVPLAGAAARRRWAAYVVGGSLAVLATVLISPLFVGLTEVVSLSQSRRLAGFAPLAFAFAGGMGVAARVLRGWAVPVMLAVGIVLQLTYPGDFGSVFLGRSPAWPAWTAGVGGCAVFVAGLLLARRVPYERSAGLVAALFLLPVFVHGLRHWSPSAVRTPSPLTPGLVDALRRDVPEGATVYSDPETSYRIAAYAPVYICVAPPGHVGNTKQNRPYERVQEFRRFVARHGDSAIPARCGARWIVIDRSRFHLVPMPYPGGPRPPLVYRDQRYALYDWDSPRGSASSSARS